MIRAAGAADRYPRHLMALAVALGLALARAPELGLSLLAAFLTFFLLASGVRPAIAVGSCALLLLAAAAGQARLHSIDADPLAPTPAGATVEIRGHLLEHPREQIFGNSMRARVSAPGGAQQVIEIRTNAPPPADAAIGDEIFARGKLSAVDPEAGSPRAAAYARYLLRNGVRRRLRAERVTLTGARRGGPLGAVDAIRRRSERALAIGLAAEPAALLRGMVLGGDNGIPEPTTDAFRAAGLAHILAVSGQNVLLLVILVQAIATALGMGRRARLLLSVGLICVYVPLCGAQASVVRAGTMGLAALAAMLASRPSSRVYTLVLAAIAVLAWNPRATADVGAQLSFAAVVGIMAFTRPISHRLVSRVPRWAAEAFAATAGATIATAPLMAYHFGTFSVVSLAANVIGAPLIGPIVWLGSLTAAIGQFSPALGALLNAPNGFLLGSLITVARVAAAVPGAQVGTAEFGTGWLVGALLAVVLAALSVNGLLPSPLAGWTRRAGDAMAFAVTGRARAGAPRSRPAMVAMLLAAVLCVFAFAVVFSGPRPIELRRPSIVMLDVGQGDAMLLLGGGDCDVLIDGGPPGADLPARLKRLGIKRLELVVASHPQLDHDGGIGDIARAGSPSIETFLDGGGNTTAPRFTTLRNRLASLGARIEPAEARTTWRCSDLVVNVLAPGALAPGTPPPADPNTRAAVTLAEVGGVRVLASGDAESPQLLPLALPRVDVLKVPHHGSADSGLPAVLTRTSPRIALIGVGAKNSFGHPTPQALAALDSAGVRTYRTDTDGSVAVSLVNGSTTQDTLQVRRDAERRR